MKKLYNLGTWILTETQLLIALDELVKSYDKNVPTELAILDLIKAFDKCPSRQTPS